MNKKIGRFIYYFLGVLLPFLIAPRFSSVCASISRQNTTTLIFMLVGLFSHILASKIALNFKLINQAKFFSKERLIPNILGFLVWGTIAFLLLAQSVRCNDVSNIVKSQLQAGMRECVIRNSENKTTKFTDIRFYLEAVPHYFFGQFDFFKIEPLDSNSCFEAKAIPKKNTIFTWFQIEMDEKTGIISKTCGDPSKAGCEKGNTW